MTDLIDRLTLPIEPTTEIRPSEAFRLGRLLRPEPAMLAFDGPGRACAIEAIHVGRGSPGDGWDGYADTVVWLHQHGIEPYHDLFAAYSHADDDDWDGGPDDDAALAYLLKNER